MVLIVSAICMHFRKFGKAVLATTTWGWLESLFGIFSPRLSFRTFIATVISAFSNASLIPHALAYTDNSDLIVSYTRNCLYCLDKERKQVSSVACIQSMCRKSAFQLTLNPIYNRKKKINSYRWSIVSVPSCAAVKHIRGFTNCSLAFVIMQFNSMCLNCVWITFQFHPTRISCPGELKLT